MLALRTLPWSLAAVVAGVSLASAQAISQQCQSTLAGLVLSSDGQCLNAQALIGVFMTSSNASLVNPINNWLTGLCAQPSCTNDTLAAVAGNLSTGCQQELSLFGFGNATSAQLTGLVQRVYPTIRQIVCLEDTTNNTLCVTESLNNLQPITGTFTPTALSTFLKLVIAASVPPLSTNITCTDCAKQTFLVLQQGFPGLAGSDAVANLDQQCGANFTNGQSPSDVNQTANAAVEASSNSSSSSGSSGSSGSNGTSGNKSNDAVLVHDTNVFGAVVSALLTAVSALAILS